MSATRGDKSRSTVSNDASASFLETMNAQAAAAYASMDAEKRTCLEQREQTESDDERALIAALKTAVPGTGFVFWPDDENAGAIASRGRLSVVGKKDVDRIMNRRGRCHQNVAEAYTKKSRKYVIVTGYYLDATNDGIWRRHSWLIAKETGRIVETTGNSATHYFGVRMDVEEAHGFAVSNCDYAALKGLGPVSIGDGARWHKEEGS